MEGEGENGRKGLGVVGRRGEGNEGRERVGTEGKTKGGTGRWRQSRTGNVVGGTNAQNTLQHFQAKGASGLKTFSLFLRSACVRRRGWAPVPWHNGTMVSPSLGEGE